MSQVDCPLMNEEELAQWILRRLGAPVIKVELCAQHIVDSIEEAKRWFSAKKGAREIIPIQGYANVVEYELPDRVDTVLDVSFMQAKLDLSLIFSPFTLLEEKIPYDVFASGGSGGLYSSYVQSLQYVEMAKRILSAELEWRQERSKDKNLLLIAPPPVDNRVMILDTKCSCFSINQLSERDHYLIRHYALAWSMTLLGEIRGKFGDYPGAQGSTTLNGVEMYQRGLDSLDKLQEEIIDTGGPLGFLTG